MQGRPGCTGSNCDVMITSQDMGHVPGSLGHCTMHQPPNTPIQVIMKDLYRECLVGDGCAEVLSNSLFHSFLPILQPWSVYNVDTTSLQHSKVHTRNKLP